MNDKAATQSFPIRIPFTEHLGVRLLEMTREHAVVSLEKRPELLNSWGATHGGVSSHPSCLSRRLRRFPMDWIST